MEAPGRAQNFNSIKVRLEPFVKMTDVVPYHDFNSIKVRLEPYAGKGSGFSQRFQFHKGTIRTLVLEKSSTFALISIP